MPEVISKPKILVIDDEDEIRSQMRWALAQDYEVVLAGDRPAAIAAFQESRPPVVTLDLGLPPQPRELEEGFQALGEILEIDPDAKIVVITGRAEKEHALRAIDLGAYDFLAKPIELEDLQVILRRAMHLYRLENENRELASKAAGRPASSIVGTSPQMERVFTSIRKVASTDVPVLVLGESGTGKELIAREIHRQSNRANGPFVAINCGAIPENLLESELFGHEKGSFTGAHVQRVGRVETAQRGTLFLDEIGDLSLPLQVKLLRYLQEHKIERVGGREEIEVDARVIAATNADLEEALKAGSFREDLYYRLGVVVIPVPPLREREGDVMVLAKAFLNRFAADAPNRVRGFTKPALRVISEYRWPGNVRELENRVRRAVIMTDGSRLSPSDLDLDTTFERFAGRTLREVREEIEREMIEQALTRNNGNVTKSASDLGVSRPTLHDLLTKYEVER